MQWVTKATQAAGDGHVSRAFALQKVGGGKLVGCLHCKKWVVASCGWWEIAGSGGVGHSHCERQAVDIVSGGGWKLCAVHVASRRWWFTLREVGGRHCEWVAVASCGQWAVGSSRCERWVVVIASRWWWEVAGSGCVREVVTASSECSRQPGCGRVDVPGVARLKVAGGGPWMCEQWVARVGQHYGGGWWTLQWVVDGERCRW